MATNGKYQNISIQPAKLPRTSKTIYQLPRENLTEADLLKKSTSDRTKRRVAHFAWFPLPVITKPVVTEKIQRKQKKNHVLKKDNRSISRISRIKPCKVRQITETVALDSARVQHIQSTSSGIEGVDDRVKADKRKLGDLGCHEVIKKKQKKDIADNLKNKDLKSEKKTVSHKEVDDIVKADKRKSGDLGCDEITKKKHKKFNVDNMKNEDVKPEKQSRPHKGVDDIVKADKRKSGDLGCDEVTKKKQKKGNVDSLKNKGVKLEKKSRPHKGVDDVVKADKKKSGDLDCDEVTKKKQKKGNVDKSKNKDVKREKKSRPRKGIQKRFTEIRFSHFTDHSSEKKISPCAMCHQPKEKFQIVLSCKLLLAEFSLMWTEKEICLP